MKQNYCQAHTIDMSKCEHYQRYILMGKDYGLLPEQGMQVAPFCWPMKNQGK